MPRRTLQQAEIVRAFEFADQQAHGRRRQVQPLRGEREAAGLGHHDEGAQLAVGDLHGFASSDRGGDCFAALKGR